MVSDDAGRERFAEFQRLYRQARSSGSTGDPVLDVLLQTAEPWFARLLRSLAAPHWFNEHSIAALHNGSAGPGSAGDAFAAIVALSCVRTHSHGYMLHDAVRTSLRVDLIQRDPTLLRTASEQLAGSVQLVEELDARRQEEVLWEAAYLRLAYDEPAGLELIQELLDQAIRKRRLATSETLVDMASEQAPLLTAEGQSVVAFWNARLAYELRHWEAAEAGFAQLEQLPRSPELAASVALYKGLTLEASGKWTEAEHVYRGYLDHVNGTAHPPLSVNRIAQRLATTRLQQGDLEAAETRAAQTLDAARAVGDDVAAAGCLELLGRTYREFRNLERAATAYNESVEIYARTDQQADRARVLGSLGDLYASFNRFEQAREYYEQARLAKAAIGDNYGNGFILANTGSLYLRYGDAGKALSHLREALQIFRQFKDHARTAEVLRAMAMAYQRLDRLGAAIEFMRDALDALPTAHADRSIYTTELHEMEHQLAHGTDERSWWRRHLWLTIGLLILALLLLLSFVSIAVGRR